MKPENNTIEALTAVGSSAFFGITPEQQQTIKRINEMSHYDMCSMWRFAPAGHPYFDCTLPYAEVFKARLFVHFGGFSPEISKALTP